ncbi:phosphoribosylanthranilate isomerase [Hyphomicrobium sp.]|jgi:phosphoribosylanthranilate isomerase|uniref:phosphoribosylanthranilate isomerase n=1 Tax=Hyphomicrobium sp. TaxID=82 RepID=UPI003569DC28
MSPIAKICGITTPEALDAAIAGGADYIGLVFFAKSPRHLEIARAKALAGLARGRVKIVALTVDASDETLQEIVDEVAPDALQLHGGETPERVAEIKRKFGRAVIKAIPVATAEDASKARDYVGVADVILFDAKASSGADLPGGNGRTFDWSVLEGVSDSIPFMLSGGLDPDNVAEAIAQMHPAAVDVSSGVEMAPGVKDPERIRRFLHVAKTAKQT